MFGHDRTSRFESPKKKHVNRPFTEAVILKDPMESKKGVKIVDDWKVADSESRILTRKAKESKLDGSEDSSSITTTSIQCHSPVRRIVQFCHRLK
jgi:hypothetical protein